MICNKYYLQHQYRYTAKKGHWQSCRIASADWVYRLITFLSHPFNDPYHRYTCEINCKCDESDDNEISQ